MHKHKNDPSSTQTHEAPVCFIINHSKYALAFKMTLHRAAHAGAVCHSIFFQSCLHAQSHRGRGHTRHFAFNEDSTEHMHSPVIALKSLIADADASDDKNDICEHLLWKLKLALERNIDFVFRLHGPIRANRLTQPDQSENNNGIAVIPHV